MTESKMIARQIRATVQEVLPTTGLTYAVDEVSRVLGITRSTRDVGQATHCSATKRSSAVATHQLHDAGFGHW